jgi:DNA-binding transcriptional ArsR family regulator
MLTRIMALLDERGSLTVEELVRATGASREAIDGMLSTLQRKGLVDLQQSPTGTGCAGCGAAGGRPAAPPIVALTLDKIKPPAEPGANGQPKTRGR